MTTTRTVLDCRKDLEWRAARAGRAGRIGLVPTMGALHDGHVALFRAARRECAIVVASIFVNPTQFADPSDLAAYPRDEGRDAGIAEAEGVDCLFAPTVDEMYPPGIATSVAVLGAALGYEGEFRPGHFSGVATVCLKLFSIVGAHAAFFGQKDAQQVAVVTQMARDFNLPIEIRVVPTVRAADGLALSSRNARLSADERRRALAIPRALEAGVAAHAAGRDVVSAARAVLEAPGADGSPGPGIDYVAVADLGGRPTLVIAARVGTTRLIDNRTLDGGASAPPPAAGHATPGGASQAPPRGE